MICPNCGKPVTADQEVCRYCGKPTQFSSQMRYVPKPVPFTGAAPAPAQEAAPRKVADPYGDQRIVVESQNKTIQKQRTMILAFAIAAACLLLLAAVLGGLFAYRSCADNEPGPVPEVTPTPELTPELTPEPTPEPEMTALTITANNISKEYGDEDPELTATIEGVRAGDTINYTLFREPGEEIGTYVISVTLGDNPYYEITVQSGTLTIREKPITVSITGEHVVATYDGEPHTATGFTANATDENYDVSNVALAPDCTAEATQTDAGTANMELKPEYFVNNDGHYTVTFEIAEDGFVTVDPLAVTVTIKGNKAENEYDGETHTVEGYVVERISSDLYTEKDFTFSGTARAERTYPVEGEDEDGRTEMGLKSEDFENKNPNFDVTFIVTDGYQEITPVWTLSQDYEVSKEMANLFVNVFAGEENSPIPYEPLRLLCTRTFKNNEDGQPDVYCFLVTETVTTEQNDEEGNASETTATRYALAYVYIDGGAQSFVSPLPIVPNGENKPLALPDEQNGWTYQTSSDGSKDIRQAINSDVYRWTALLGTKGDVKNAEAYCFLCRTTEKPHYVLVYLRIDPNSKEMNTEAIDLPLESLTYQPNAEEIIPE